MAEFFMASKLFYVLDYGSLMWDPGFDYDERQNATLTGWHRSPSVFSTIDRGTPEVPGLVLGLDEGGACHGIVYGARMEAQDKVMEYLRARDLKIRFCTWPNLESKMNIWNRSWEEPKKV
jgi:cation transport protein ChaC